MTRFKQMWEAQWGLMEQMEEIEKSNGLLEHQGVLSDLDDPKQQIKLRRLAWQIVEEVSEVIEEVGNARREEIADVLHFLIELMIVSGIELDGGPFDLLEIAFKKSTGHLPNTNFGWAAFVNQLGCAIHELKNRPWRTNRRPTDQAKFHRMLMDSLFDHFVAVVKEEDIPLDDLYAEYFRKREINEERAVQSTKEFFDHALRDAGQP